MDIEFWGLIQYLLFSDMEKQSKKKSVECRQGRKKHIFGNLIVARWYLYVKRKAMEMGKMHGVSERETLQTPCLLLSQTLFPPPKINGGKK